MLKSFFGRWSGLVKPRPAGPGNNTRKGLSLTGFFRRFPDENAAETWFERVRWGAPDHTGGVPSGMYCPLCGSVDRIRPRENRRPLPWWCGDCNRSFSVRARTVLEASNIPLHKWVAALYLHLTSLKGVSSMKLHRDLDVTQRSSWFLGHRIRHAFSGQGKLRSKASEIDEAFFGGLEKNKHFDKKLRAGRGTTGKSAVVGMRDRRTGKVVAEVIPNTESYTLQEFVRRHLRRGGTLFSDSATAYSGFDWPGRHESVKHGQGQYARSDVHVNGMESFWATMKRAYKGTFHQMSPKHLQRYVDEFVGRHNLRNLDTLEQMELVASRMMGKRLKYRDLVK